MLGQVLRHLANQDIAADAVIDAHLAARDGLGQLGQPLRQRLAFARGLIDVGVKLRLVAGTQANCRLGKPMRSGDGAGLVVVVANKRRKRGHLLDEVVGPVGHVQAASARHVVGQVLEDLGVFQQRPRVGLIRAV
jgi:hypothetical protein